MFQLSSPHFLPEYASVSYCSGHDNEVFQVSSLMVSSSGVWRVQWEPTAPLSFPLLEGNAWREELLLDSWFWGAETHCLGFHGQCSDVGRHCKQESICVPLQKLAEFNCEKSTLMTQFNSVTSQRPCLQHYHDIRFYLVSMISVRFWKLWFSHLGL